MDGADGRKSSIMVRRCGVVVRCGCNCGCVGFAWVGLEYRVRARWKLPLDSPGKYFFSKI